MENGDKILGTYVETIYNGGPDLHEDFNELEQQEYTQNRLYTHIFKNGDEYNSINHNKPSLLAIMTDSDPILSYCSGILECTENCSKDLLFMTNGTCFDINENGTCTLHPTLQQIKNQATQNYYTLTTTLPEAINNCLIGNNNCSISGGKKRKSKRKISKRSRTKKSRTKRKI